MPSDASGVRLWLAGVAIVCPFVHVHVHGPRACAYGPDAPWTWTMDDRRSCQRGTPAISRCYHTVILACGFHEPNVGPHWFCTAVALNMHCHCIGTAGIP